MKTPLYTATITGDGDLAGAVDTDSLKISGAFKPMSDLKVILSYGFYDRGSDFTAITGTDDSDASSTELVFKYSGIKNVDLFLSYMYTDHNGIGAYRGADVDDELNTVRLKALYYF